MKICPIVNGVQLDAVPAFKLLFELILANDGVKVTEDNYELLQAARLNIEQSEVSGQKEAQDSIQKALEVEDVLFSRLYEGRDDWKSLVGERAMARRAGEIYKPSDRHQLSMRVAAE